MKRVSSLALAGLCLLLSSLALAAPKDDAVSRGGQSGERMSEQGEANSNAQHRTESERGEGRAGKRRAEPAMPHGEKGAGKGPKPR